MSFKRLSMFTLLRLCVNGIVARKLSACIYGSTRQPFLCARRPIRTCARLYWGRCNRASLTGARRNGLGTSLKVAPTPQPLGRIIRDAINTLIAIDLADGVELILDWGFDFYASPAISPDGSRLAWLSWRHPYMPWIATYLTVAQFDSVGELGSKQTAAGGETESIFQPQWSSANILYFVMRPPARFRVI